MHFFHIQSFIPAWNVPWLMNFWPASVATKQNKSRRCFFFFQPLLTSAPYMMVFFCTVSSSVGHNNSYYTFGHYYNYKMVPVYCSAQRVESDFRLSPRLCSSALELCLLFPLFQIFCFVIFGFALVCSLPLTSHFFFMFFLFSRKGVVHVGLADVMLQGKIAWIWLQKLLKYSEGCLSQN